MFSAGALLWSRTDEGEQKGGRNVVWMQRKHIRGMTSEPVSSSRRSKIGLTLLQRDVVLFFCPPAKKAVSGSIVGESVVVL